MGLSLIVCVLVCHLVEQAYVCLLFFSHLYHLYHIRVGISLFKNTKKYNYFWVNVLYTMDFKLILAGLVFYFNLGKIAFNKHNMLIKRFLLNIDHQYVFISCYFLYLMFDHNWMEKWTFYHFCLSLLKKELCKY